MSLSYSFHLSSKSHAVATVSKLGQVSRHNLRNYKSEDFDKEKIKILVGGDKSIFQNVQEIYHQEFDEVLKKYNEKQTREDRKISNYLEHISESKTDVAAEIIVQIGDRDFWSGVDKKNWNTMNKVFQSQIDKLKELVPEFKIASATVHLDESSPHMHIVGVPVANGFKKGLEKQVSKTKIFTKNSLTFLQDEMRKNMESEIRKYPEIFEIPVIKEKEKGRNKDIPKYKLDEFYQLEKDKKTIQKEIASIEMNQDTLLSKNEDLKQTQKQLEDEIKQLESDKEEIISLVHQVKQEAENDIYQIQSNITEIKQDYKKAIEEFPSVNYIMKEREPEIVRLKDGSFFKRLGFDFNVVLKLRNWIKQYLLPLQEKNKKIEKQIEATKTHPTSILEQIRSKGTQSNKTSPKRSKTHDMER